MQLNMILIRKMQKIIRYCKHKWLILVRHIIRILNIREAINTTILQIGRKLLFYVNASQNNKLNLNEIPALISHGILLVCCMQRHIYFCYLPYGLFPWDETNWAHENIKETRSTNFFLIFMFLRHLSNNNVIIFHLLWSPS